MVMKFIFNKAGATCFLNSPVSIIESVGVALVTNVLMCLAMFVSCLYRVMFVLCHVMFVSRHVCVMSCLCQAMLMSCLCQAMFVYRVMFVTFSTNA